jgi:hypothetical protein
LRSKAEAPRATSHYLQFSYEIFLLMARLRNPPNKRVERTASVEFFL